MFLWLLPFLVVVSTHANLQSFAVVRPFAPSDSSKLVDSFKQWSTNLPCSAGLPVPVDLFLCFSQTLESNAEARAATAAIIEEFEREKSRPTSSWQKCFRSVKAISTNLKAEEDVYDVVHPEGDTNWVKGPNMQFLAMAQGFESSKWGSYGAWFLMEMDTVARKPLWLSLLLDEVTARTPFAVLGSFYRGDSWQKLTMPPAVQYHINGNAVYNHSNPLMKTLLAALAADMAMGPLPDAYDTHMAAVFLSSELSSEEFGWYIGDSAVIGNYAHTAMLEEYYHGEALVHGGWLFNSWNIAEEPVALVVSDFGVMEGGQPALSVFTDSFLKGQHPFREVVVVRPAGHAAAVPYTLHTQEGHAVTFTEVSRAGSAWLDWCAAPVKSPWFMYANTDMHFGRRIDLLRSKEGNHALLTYIPSNTPYCTDFEVCPYSMKRAFDFSGVKVVGHFQPHQTVFHSALRTDFCKAWEEWNTAALAADPLRQACDPMPGPTADDFVAYLSGRDALGIYALEDAVRIGQRDRGIPRHHIVDVRPCALSMPRATTTNTSACEGATTADECGNITNCEWVTIAGISGCSESGGGAGVDDSPSPSPTSGGGSGGGSGGNTGNPGTGSGTTGDTTTEGGSGAVVFDPAPTTPTGGTGTGTTTGTEGSSTGSSSSSSDNGAAIGIAVGVSVGVFLCILCCCCFVLWWLHEHGTIRSIFEAEREPGPSPPSWNINTPV